MKEVKSYLQIFEVKKRQDIEKQTNQFNFLSKHKKLELFVVKTMNRKRYEFNVGERKEDLVTDLLCTIKQRRAQGGCLGTESRRRT